MLQHTIPSAVRIAAFAKYLVALSESLENAKDEKISRSEEHNDSSSHKKRRHILYLINDLLHHTKYHVQDSSAFSTLAENLWTYVVDLFRVASTYDLSRSKSQNRKIQNLLSIWALHGYYDDSSIQKLRDTIAAPINGNISNVDESSKVLNGTPGGILEDEKSEVRCSMPATHGDPATPYYDLPAGNMMPHIFPNSGTPINPQALKPLQFGKASATEDLVMAVKNFMKDISMSVGSAEHDNVCVDINDLGQPSFRDGCTGELIQADGYYGWSKEFCEKMRLRQNRQKRYVKSSRTNKDVDRSWSPRKRPRYSRSESSNGSRRSRSSSPASYRGAPRRGSSPRREVRQRSYSRGRSSPSQIQSSTNRPRSRSISRSRLRSASRSNSYSPPPPQHPPNLQQRTPNSMKAKHSQDFPLPRSNALPPPIHQNFLLGPGGMPIPPPPPPNFKGIWPPPPPPPPPPPAQLPPNFIPSGSPYPAFQSFAPTHPPGIPNTGSFPFVQAPPDFQRFSSSSDPRP